MLSKEERLEYCKFCENGHKTESGEWLCKLTIQEPSFDCICYDYKETQARAHLRRINEETDIAINNEGVDYTQLNWDDLEPKKEIPFCPDKKEIVQEQYVNKEIVAVPINDVRWWVIDKIPDIDLSKHLKIIVRNSYWHMHFSHWLFLGAGASGLFILFFYACSFSLNISILLALLSGACISLVGYFKDIKSGRTKHSCVEINRLDGFIKLPDDRFRYVIPFENVYFHLIGGGNMGVSMLYLAMILPSTVGNIVRKIPFFEMYYKNKVIEALSIFVWYMDKNRPLPPGTEFDKFRQKDFDRRKAEGFPPPMYLSHIPTPEATEEQQTERENFWKDENYKVTDMTTRDRLLEWNKRHWFKVKYSHLKTPKK